MEKKIFIELNCWEACIVLGGIVSELNRMEENNERLGPYAADSGIEAEAIANGVKLKERIEKQFLEEFHEKRKNE